MTLHTFVSAKHALAQACMLSHPCPNARLTLQTDASDVGIGAVLEQKVEGTWHPLAFTSRSFTWAETRYSVFDCKLLAAYHAVRHLKGVIAYCILIICLLFNPFTEVVTPGLCGSIDTCPPWLT